MTRHRTTCLLVTFFLSLTAATVPSSALAGSLLSGYGAPGSGAQAILGSALLNGGGGSSGGGASTGGGAGGSASGVGGGSAATGQAGAAGQGAGAATRSTGGSDVHDGRTRASGAPQTSAGGFGAYTYSGSPHPAAGLQNAADSGPLGLTGTDLLLLALVLGVLAVTAGLTRRLASMQHYWRP